METNLSVIGWKSNSVFNLSIGNSLGRNLP